MQTSLMISFAISVLLLATPVVGKVSSKAISKKCLLPPPLRNSNLRPFCSPPYVPDRICHAEGNTCTIKAMNTSITASHVCSVVAHALLTDFELFDVVFLDDTLCPSEILAGELDHDHLYSSILPYNEQLVVLQLNGSDLRAAVEHGLDQFHFHHNPTSYPRVAGMQFKVNLQFPFGSRMKKIKILNNDCKWKKIKSARIYHVLTTESLATTYPTMTRAMVRTPLKDMYLTDSFWNYAQSMCVVYDPFRPVLNHSSRVVEGERKLEGMRATGLRER